MAGRQPRAGLEEPGQARPGRGRLGGPTGGVTPVGERGQGAGTKRLDLVGDETAATAARSRRQDQKMPTESAGADTPTLLRTPGTPSR